MSNQQLTENYIYACTKRLPRRYREMSQEDFNARLRELKRELRI